LRYANTARHIIASAGNSNITSLKDQAIPGIVMAATVAEKPISLW
jgi:hypothetical protein